MINSYGKCYIPYIDWCQRQIQFWHQTVEKNPEAQALPAIAEENILGIQRFAQLLHQYEGKCETHYPVAAK